MCVCVCVCVWCVCVCVCERQSDTHIETDTETDRPERKTEKQVARLRDGDLESQCSKLLCHSLGTCFVLSIPVLQRKGENVKDDVTNQENK